MNTDMINNTTDNIDNADIVNNIPETPVNTKPISVIINEAKQSLADTINSLQFSPTILEMILKDIYMEVQILARQELQDDMQNMQRDSVSEK